MYTLVAKKIIFGGSMRTKKVINYFHVFLYIVFGVGALFLRYVGANGEPLGLALVYAMASAGLSPVLSAFLYTISLMGLIG